MKCYNHPSTDGVAVCKSCGRAICHDCCAEVETSCACKGRCEGDVGDINVMLKRGRSVYQKTGGAYRRNAGILLLMGILFASIGGYSLVAGKDKAGVVALFFGVLFMVWAYLSFQSAKQFTNVDK